MIVIMDARKESAMRYMKIVCAHNIEEARQSYLALLERHGVVLGESLHMYCETVHRPEKIKDTWLCYTGKPRPKAA